LASFECFFGAKKAFSLSLYLLSLLGGTFRRWLFVYYIVTLAAISLDALSIASVFGITSFFVETEMPELNQNLWLWFLVCSTLLRFVASVAHSLMIKHGSLAVSELFFYSLIDRGDRLLNKVELEENREKTIARNLSESALIFNGLIAPFTVLFINTSVLLVIIVLVFSIFSLTQQMILMVGFGCFILIGFLVAQVSKEYGNQRSSANISRFFEFGQVINIRNYLSKTRRIGWAFKPFLFTQRTYYDTIFRSNVLQQTPKASLDLFLFLGALLFTSVGSLEDLSIKDPNPANPLSSTTVVAGVALLFYRVAPILNAIMSSAIKFATYIGVWNQTVRPLLSSLKEKGVTRISLQTLNRSDNARMFQNVCDLGHPLTIKGSYFTNLGGRVINFTDLTLEPGKITLLQGESGLGKTTLARAIHDYMNYGDNDFGLVFSGKGITGNDTFLCAYNSAPFSLYKNSLLSNVTLSESINEEETRAVLKALDASAFLEVMEERKIELKTIVDSEKMGLSAGEQARLSIARDLFWCEGCLIFDETLSHLQLALTDRILARIIKSYPHLSIIIISHNYKGNYDYVCDLVPQKTLVGKC